MSYNLLNIIILLGGLQGLLLAFMFLTSEKFNKTSNWFLAANLITISLINIISGIKDADVHGKYPIVNLLPLIWYFLIPVTLYYFIQYLLKPTYQFKKKEYCLFLPFVIHFVIQSYWLFLFLTNPGKLEEMDTLVSTINITMETMAVIYCFAFLLLIYQKLNRFEKQLFDNYSEIENKSILWLKRILLAIFILWSIWAISYLFYSVQGTFSKTIMYSLWIGISIIIYWLGYSTYSRRDIFEITDLIDNESEPEKITNGLSQKTELHYHKLIALMEEEKLYKDPNLSMSILAQKLDLSNGYLSQIINQKEGKNFFEFVNAYRVEAVKQILADPEYAHYSMLGIGLEAGFKSKSTFNAVFKKLTGKTPTAYKKALSF